MTISGNLSPFQLHPVHRMLLESANTEFSKRLVSAFLDSSTAVSRADSASHWRKGGEQKGVIALAAFMSSSQSSPSPPGSFQRWYLLLSSVLYSPVYFLTAVKSEDAAWGKR